jgi:hypothetical protein
MDIGIELDRLFKLHDRPLDPEKKAAFVSNIAQWGYPFMAIIDGIKKLRDTEMRFIRACDIKAAVEKLITYDTEFEECAICVSTGSVIMESDIGYAYAMPCKCPRGQKMAEAQRLPRWNGFRTQDVRGQKRTLIWPDPVKHNIGFPDDESRNVAEQFGGEVVGAGKRWEE